METIYDFVVETNKGVTYKLDAYKGDVMLIVNTARMALLHNSKVCNHYTRNTKIKGL